MPVFTRARRWTYAEALNPVPTPKAFFKVIFNIILLFTPESHNYLPV